MDLSNLRPAAGATRKRKRIGRGPGSGHGKTSGKGHKGRGSRSGGNTPPGYEGGQMPLSRRLPKYGFNNIFREEFNIVNIGSLERFDTGSVVDAAKLVEVGLVKNTKKKVKILADGTLTKSLIVKAQAFSKQAQEKIVSLGGTAEVI
ncbi:MAG: 50S ribosomal protein L15 [Deltaproteobacteria bacterium]|nr:50S ribosomal protein L15 [Deltaproteobacteria bacterium]